MPVPYSNIHTDLVLVSLIDEGDEQAFQDLYSRHWQGLYNDAYRRLGDVEKSKDIVQDVFLQFWQKQNRSHILNVAAYLSQSVRYNVIKCYNKEKSIANFELPLEMLPSDISIEEAFFAKELEAYIKVWLTIQPERRRQIFQMRYIEDKSTKEISDQLGISQKTVQKTLFITLNNLKDALGKFTAYLSFLYLLQK